MSAAGGRRKWIAPPSAIPANIRIASRKMRRAHAGTRCPPNAVCRAGANTVSELCATGMPSVLVALPGAPGDHQAANAAVLERAGAAVVVVDAELSAQRLDDVLTGLLSDDERRAAMSAAARSLSHPDAARRVAEVVRRHAR